MYTRTLKTVCSLREASTIYVLHEQNPVIRVHIVYLEPTSLISLKSGYLTA